MIIFFLKSFQNPSQGIMNHPLITIKLQQETILPLWYLHDILVSSGFSLYKVNYSHRPPIACVPSPFTWFNWHLCWAVFWWWRLSNWSKMLLQWLRPRVQGCSECNYSSFLP